jgi:hypothetical protein
MRYHQDIDRRSLAMAKAVAELIDADPAQAGLERACAELDAKAAALARSRSLAARRGV